MPKIVELRQDRNLICSNFDGFKLSLDPIPILSLDLSVPPFKAIPTQDQYSFLHAELFSIQNLLHVDPWERNNSYFININNEIVRTSYNESIGRPEPLQVVFTHPIYQKQPGDYNSTLNFVSEKFCILCNGIQSLYLLDTADRRKTQPWKLLAEFNISTIIDVEERGFVILDARLDIIKEIKQISIALARVKKLESIEDKQLGTQHFMIIYWMICTFVDNKWQCKFMESLCSKGSIYYCAFEPRADSLILGSNHEFKFNDKLPINEESMVRLKLGAEPAENFDNLSWTQTDDNVIIKMNTSEKLAKSEYKIICTTNNLLIKTCNEKLLQHELFAEVDEDLTTWIIENDFLQITLIKRQSALHWPSLFTDFIGPQETVKRDAENKGDSSEHQPITNLEAPIEDCDFPLGLSDDDIKIERFHLPSKTITHSILLGSNPPLFCTILRPGYPKAFAVRQDVDASLYLQNFNASKPLEWGCRHEGNLHTFGYVQASKQQKKFIDCSPDLSYALICESSRHIFL